MERATRRMGRGLGAALVCCLTACLDRDGSSDAGAAAVDAPDDASQATAQEDAGDLCATCEDQWAFSTSLAACCGGGAVCGLEVSGLASLVTAAAPSGCFERDAPGVRSDYCSAVFDRVDGTRDYRYLLGSQGGTMGFAACCSARGECGLGFARVELALASQRESADLGLGCVGLGELERMLGDALYPLGKAKLDLSTACDPETGELDPWR